MKFEDIAIGTTLNVLNTSSYFTVKKINGNSLTLYRHDDRITDIFSFDYIRARMVIVNPQLHRDIIVEWANGKKIESFLGGHWYPVTRPTWDIKEKYRVMPVRLYEEEDDFITVTVTKRVDIPKPLNSCGFEGLTTIYCVKKLLHGHIFEEIPFDDTESLDKLFKDCLYFYKNKDSALKCCQILNAC